MPRLRPITALMLAPLALLAAGDDDLFFESKVRPVLIKRCYDCHSTDKKTKGGLALDTRAGDEILQILRARCDAGAAVLLVTHEPRYAAWADRVDAATL